MLSRKSLRNTLVALLMLTGLSEASTVTIPNNFVANTPAVAAQVNANFSNIKTAVDDNDGNISSNDTDIAALLVSVTQLQADLTTANAQITMLTNALSDTNNAFGVLSDEVDDLTTDLATANATIAVHDTRILAIEANTVLELDGYLMLSTMNGYDTAEFTGVNLQVNNGTNQTSGAVNGLGNLIVGYNEMDALASSFCSDPQYFDSITCDSGGGIWANNVRRGSHNLIVGYANSYDDFGAIVSGSFNTSNNLYANVTGGRYNRTNGFSSSISGGYGNRTSGDYSSVSGGFSNSASGFRSSVLGGRLNSAIGSYSSVSGGIGNKASGENSSVSGGSDNNAQGYGSSVSGGYNRDTPVGVQFDASEYDWRAGTLTENF